jgi:glutathione synthase/RimK-type ligase-like ATP-grasp enzyme
VVVRSAWDYARRHDDFLAWARAVPRLANPAEVIAWNTDKRYLGELAAVGVPVVPTRWYAPGDPLPEPEGPVVVKPTISAGARDTRRHDEPAAATAHVEELLAAGRTAMVQPYVAAVDAAGETGLVFVAGRFSHAFGKGALLRAGDRATSALFAEEEITEREPSARELEVGEQVLEAAELRGPAPRSDLLYARVDLVPGNDGDPLLLELELAEPSLFFRAGHGAAQRWAEAVRTAAAATAARR